MKALPFIALLAIYWASARVGLILHATGGFASLVWVASGAALSGLLIGGTRLWPAIPLASFLVNFNAGAPVGAALGIAIGNTTEALLGAFLIHRFMKKPESLGSVHNMFRFVLVGALVPSLAAAMGCLSLYFNGALSFHLLPAAMRDWWLGDTMGILLISPFMLSWVSWLKQKDPPFTLEKSAEGIFLLTSSIIAALYVFFESLPTADPINVPRNRYLIFPFLIWSGVRFGLRGASTISLLVSSISVWAVLLQSKSVQPEFLEMSLFHSQLFMGIISITTLVLGAAVTERSLAEQSERKSRAQLHSILDNSTSIVSMKDMNKRYLLINRKFEEEHVLSRTQVLNRKDSDLFSPDIATLFETNDQEVLVTQRPLTHEETIQVGAFQKVFLSSRYLLKDNHLKPYAICCISTDITERKRSDFRKQFLLDSGKVIFSTLDYSETIQAIARLTIPILADWCLIDIIDGDMRQVAVAHSDPTKEKKALALGRFIPEERSLDRGPLHVIKTGIPEIYPEVTNLNWVGDILGVGHPKFLRELEARSYLCVPLATHGKIRGAMTLIFGESKRRYDLQHLELAMEVAERAGIAEENARLYQESKNAIQVREDLLAIVSHDLKTPLTAMDLNVSLLDRLIDSESLDLKKLHQIAERIKSSIKTMLTLISDLLDLAKINSGKLTLRPKLCDVCKLLESTLELMNPIFIDKGIKLKIRMPESNLKVFCDPDRVLQILSNLLTNAARFSPESSDIQIEVVRLDNWIKFSISDHGPGIPESQIQHLFERFWQGQHTIEKGTGLGLSIVKGIVESHCGQVWAQSSPGKGSTFYFTLPMENTNKTESQSAA